MATPTTAGTTAVRLGAAIRATREARGLSLRELARRIEVSPSFVSQIELGKANPSVATLYALVGVLGTTLDDLIGDPDGEAPHGAGPGGVEPVELLRARGQGATEQHGPRAGQVLAEPRRHGVSWMPRARPLSRR